LSPTIKVISLSLIGNTAVFKRGIIAGRIAL